MADLLLFRYRAANGRLFEAITHSTLYFASPRDLNDPFDCQVDVARCLERAIAESDGTAQQYLLKLRAIPNFGTRLNDGLAKLGICSFSMTAKDSLMWSHYADDHRGVCLLYRIPEEFFLDQRTQVIGVAPVTYAGRSPLLEWFKTTAPKLGEPGAPGMGVELCKKLFTIKDPCWAYEQEVRAIREVPGSLQIPTRFLAQIIFGLRTPQDVIERLKRDAANKKIEYFHMRRSEEDFGIEVDS
jgi:hypothetical protein